MLSQVRSGGVEFFTLSPLILSTLVPNASISGIGFAFPNYDTVWKAMDGELGAYVRGQISKANLVVMDKIWDNGFRQITSSNKPIQTPDDLKGFKIRVPVSPLWTSMFSAFGSAPASINFAEVYTALQTKVVDGQENPLAIISTAKLFEVQKYRLHDQPHVGRLLVPGQPPRLGAPAGGSARHRGEATSTPRPSRSAPMWRSSMPTVKGELTTKGMSVQRHRIRLSSARRCARPASMPSGRRSTATKPGRSSRSPSAAA